MLFKLRKKYANTIYLEFGSYLFKAYSPSTNKKIHIPSIVYTDNDYEEIQAIGEEALKKVSGNKYQVIRPFNNGTIQDFKATELFLKYNLSEILNEMNIVSKFLRPNILVAVHSNFSEVELSAFTDAITSFGVSSVTFINEGVSSHYVNKDNSSSSAVVTKVGYSITDLLIIVDNEILYDSTFQFGIRTLIRSISTHLKEKYSVVVSEKKILEVIKNIDLNSKKKMDIEVSSKNLRSGLPIKIKIDINEIKDIIYSDLEILLSSIQKIIEKAPSEIIDQVINTGLSLTGGGINIKGVSEFIKANINLDVNINSDIYSSVYGLEYINSSLELLDNFKVKDLIFL